MKKQTYITPAINVTHIAPALMITPVSPLHLIYRSDDITPEDAAYAASRGSIFWFDDEDE